MKMRRFAMILLAVLSIGFLVGDDCEIDVDSLPWFHDGGHYYDDVYYYEPAPIYYPGPVYYY
jgi:hypothetical protein